MSDAEYKKFWEDLGKDKGGIYLKHKFEPTYRIGLTNYLREEMIYKFLKPQPEDVILDVGCASGRQLFRIADKIKEGHGIDIAQSFIDEANDYKARNIVKNLFFRQSAVEKLPFLNGYFDKIICAEVLEHVFDKDAALNELLRVLKKDGILIISVPNINADGTLYGRLLRTIGIRKFTRLNEFSRAVLTAHGDSHVREFSGKILTDWLKNRGLQILDMKSVSFIDGPYFDFLLKIPLRFNLGRKIIIFFERILTNSNLFFGRHLVVKSIKK